LFGQYFLATSQHQGDEAIPLDRYARPKAGLYEENMEQKCQVIVVVYCSSILSVHCAISRSQNRNIDDSEFKRESFLLIPFINLIYASMSSI